MQDLDLGGGKKKKKTHEEEEIERARSMGANKSAGGTIWTNNMRPGFDFVGNAISKEKRGSNVPKSMQEADATRREADYQNKLAVNFYVYFLS